MAGFKVTTEDRANSSRKAEFIIPDGLSASGDAVLLRIVVDNLIGNAWKPTSLVGFAPN
jgi:hypothetical protein